MSRHLHFCFSYWEVSCPTSFVAFFFLVGQRCSSFFFSVLGSFLKYLDERILNFGSAPGLFTGVEGEWQWRMAWLHVGVCCFPFPSFFLHAVQC